MVVSSPLRGLIIELITPLKDSGDIDGRGLGKLLDRVLPHAHALMLASPGIGEGINLHVEQREELLDKSVVVVRGKLPILIWVSGKTEEATREIFNRLKGRLDMRNYSGPVYWVDTPLYYHSNRGLPLYYQSLSATLKEPFLLLNDPALVKEKSHPLKRSNIRTGILKELVQIQSIRGLIFLGSLDRARNYQKAVRSRENFPIYDGDESHFLQHPSIHGVVSGGANLVPKVWEAVTASSLHISGNKKNYPDHIQQIWEMGSYLHDLREIYSKNPPSILKQTLWDMGLIESPKSLEKKEHVSEQSGLIKRMMEERCDWD